MDSKHTVTEVTLDVIRLVQITHFLFVMYAEGNIFSLNLNNPAMPNRRYGRNFVSLMFDSVWDRTSDVPV